MRLTTTLPKVSFASQLKVMKKFLVAVVVLFVVGINIMMLLPKPAVEANTEECVLGKSLKISLAEVKLGIIPNLLKS